MRQFMRWQFVAALTVGITWAGSSQAGEFLGRKPPRSIGEVVGDWFGVSQPPRPSAPTTPAATTAAAPAAGLRKPSSVAMVDQAALIQNREQQALLRRLATCDKFMQVGLETRNEPLQRQAKEMEDRAWRIYRERIASLGGNAPNRADEAALDRQLGNPADGRQLVQPGRGTNGDTSRQASAGGSYR